MTKDEILCDVAQSLGCDVSKVPGDLADSQLNKVLGLADGTVEVKRCRGSLEIPSYKVGRSRRTPLSAVIAFKLSQINGQLEGMGVA